MDVTGLNFQNLKVWRVRMSAKFNQILILDSIPAGQLNTARRLEEDVAVLAAVAEDGGPAVVYQRIESAKAFVTLITDCADLAKRVDYVPLVHLECHGSQEGLEFADGSNLSWLDVKNVVTPLNIATRLNLIFVISACHGFTLASKVYATDPAPIYAFVGPSRDMNAQELLTGFLAFYKDYLLTRSSSEAIKALKETAEQGAFVALTSRSIFNLVIDGYRKHHCNPESLAERAKSLQLRARAEKIEINLEVVMGALGAPEWETRFRKIFFMIDRYPDHEARFPMTAA